MKISKVPNRTVAIGTRLEFSIPTQQIQEVPRGHFDPESTGCIDRYGRRKATGKPILGTDLFTFPFAHVKEAGGPSDPDSAVTVFDHRASEQSRRTPFDGKCR